MESEKTRINLFYTVFDMQRVERRFMEIMRRLAEDEAVAQKLRDYYKAL